VQDVRRADLIDPAHIVCPDISNPGSQGILHAIFFLAVSTFLKSPSLASPTSMQGTRMLLRSIEMWF
jgi:hypothetical protein